MSPTPRICCPGDAPGKYPDPKRPGCPLPDADGDGIPDSMDACPNQAGMPNPTDRRAERLPEDRAEGGHDHRAEDGQLRESTSGCSCPRASPVLDAVAKNLNEHLEWRKIQIEGHADDTGTTAWNLRLSKHRAQAVMEYLITKGVKRSRLDYVGYGDTKPLVADEVGRGARQEPPRRDSDSRPQVVVVDYGWYLNSNG